MTFTVRINEEALKDLESIHAYIAADNLTYAKQTVNEILERIEEIQAYPNSGMRLANKTKRKTNYLYKVIKSYLVFYLVKDSEVTIMRILQGNQRYNDLLND